jgi:hypothetical protein
MINRFIYKSSAHIYQTRLGHVLSDVTHILCVTAIIVNQNNHSESQEKYHHLK